jgi:hypothetical protein
MRSPAQISDVIGFPSSEIVAQSRLSTFAPQQDRPKPGACVWLERMIMSTRRMNSETYNATGRPTSNAGWNSEFERVFLAVARIRGELAASRIRGETVCDRVPRDSVSPQRPARSKCSLLRRWFESFTASQQRRADREIARYITSRSDDR